MVKQKKGEIKIFLILLIGLLFVGVGSGLVSAACPDGMVSYWTFDNDDLSGSDPLDTVGSNNGINYGATTGVAGQVGQAFDFDGVDDYVDCGNDESLDITGAITIAAWVNYAGSGGADVISKVQIANGYGPYSLFFGDSAQGYVESSDGHTWDTLILTEDSYPAGWHFVVGTNDGTTARLYVDGTEVGSDNSPATTKCTISEPTRIGWYYGGSGNLNRHFNGLIDEVAIFNRALSAEEISDLYDLGVAGKGYCEEIGFGNLTTYWVTPVTDTNVQQNQFFKVQIGVNCTGGKCGDVNVTLDPKEVQKAIEDYKAQQNIITGDVVEEVEDEMNFFEMILDFIKGVFGR